VIWNRQANPLPRENSSLATELALDDVRPIELEPRTNLPVLSLQDLSKCADVLVNTGTQGRTGLRFDEEQLGPIFRWNRIRDGSAHAEFLRSLDQEVVAACRHLGMASQELYNAVITEDCELKQRRLQALGVMPVLGVLLARRRGQDVAMLRRAIDDRASLFDAAASAFGSPREAIRFVARQRLADLDLPGSTLLVDAWCHRPKELFQLLGEMPVAWRPRSPAEWNVLYEVLMPQAVVDEIPRRWLTKFLRNAAKQGFLRTGASLQVQHGGIRALLHVAHFVTTLRHIVDKLHPSVNRNWECRWQAVDRMIDNLPVDAVLTQAAQWRSEMNQLWEESLRKNAVLLPKEPFAPPIPIPAAIGKWRIVFLSTFSDLDEEASALRNCLRYHIDDCISGRRLFFSVRHANGERIGVFDFSIRTKDGHCTVDMNQCLGPGNISPSTVVASVADAVRRYARRHVRKSPRVVVEWEKARQKLCEGIPLGSLLGPDDDSKKAAALSVVGGEARLRSLIEHAIRR